ncbi:MAG: amidase [Actinobacteria bacterium]|nr:amidase [Actinomycetota bacterium]
MDFREETVEGLVRQVRRREIGVRELVAAALERIASIDGELGAFVAVDEAGALAAAEALDRRLAVGEEAPPLAGIPIGVKDLEDAAGLRTTHGSVFHADDPPATADSILVARLKAAGCIVLGKTNTPEHGCKAHTSNGIGPPTRNPWNPQRTAGGSSGGTAAALAAGLVPLGTGSDGGGSIRIPSALCGITGFKPSLGRVPSGGDKPPGWPDVSTKGVMARRVRDIATACDQVVAPDPTDPASLPMPREPWRPGLEDLHPPARVGWSATLGYAPVDPEVRRVCEAAVERLAALGTEVVEVPTVFEADPMEAWFTWVGAANMRTFGHLRGTPDWERIDPDLRFGIDWVVDLGPDRVIAARDAMHRDAVALARTLADVHLLLTPTVAARTPAIDEWGVLDGQPEANWIRFTYPFNSTRSPAGTVCAGLDGDGLPVGLQVVGPQHGDVAVLRLLAVLEDELGSFAPPSPV